MVAVSNSILCDNCTPAIDVDFIQSLQDSLDRKVARTTYRKYNSEKGDLALCFDEENTLNSTIYWNILERIKYCDGCFEGMKIDEIVDLVKKNI